MLSSSHTSSRRLILFSGSLLSSLVLLILVSTQAFAQVSGTLAAPLVGTRSIDGGLAPKSSTPNFTWTAVTGATTYTVEVCKVLMTTAACPATSLAVPVATVSTLSWVPTAELPRNVYLYWHVRANAVGYGSSPWSTAQGFQSANPPPRPVLTAFTTPQPLSPKLIWTTTLLATSIHPLSYEVQVCSDALCNTPVVNINTSGTAETGSTATLLKNSWTVSPNLTAGTQYYWRVRTNSGTSASGTASMWSLISPFKTSIGTAANILPANGSVTEAGTPTFTWSAAPGAGVTSYTVQYTASGNPAGVYVALGTVLAPNTSFTPTVALPKPTVGTVLYWRVVSTPVTGFGVATTSAPFSLTPATLPPLPALVAPLATAVQTLTPTLTWKTTVTAAGLKPDQYRIQISTDPKFGTTVVDTTKAESNALPTLAWTNTYVVPAGKLVNGTQYYWRVQGKITATGGDATAWVPAANTAAALGAFKTSIAAAANASPLNAATTEDGAPTFSWSASPGVGVVSYTVQYTASGNPAGAYVALGTVLSPNTTFTPTVALPKPTVGTVLYWRVLANPVAGFGVATPSAPFSLTPATVPPLPALVGPAATVAQSLTPTLTWKTTVTAAGIKPTQYRIQISTDPKFGTTVVDATKTESNALPTLIWTNTYIVPAGKLVNGTQYYWRVQGENTATGGDSTAWAPAANTAAALGAFKTSIGTALNAGPFSGYTAEVGTPTFSWNAAPGAGVASYTVQYTASGNSAGAYVALGTVLVPNTTFTPTVALPKPTVGTVLYWRVVTNPVAGYGVATTSAPFSITPATVPPLPALVGPAATAVQTLTPTLTWKTTVTAAGIKPNQYHLQISIDPKFGTTVVDTTTTESNALPALIWTNTYVVPAGKLVNGTQYYWRVQGKNTTTGGDATAWVPVANTAAALGAFKTILGTPDTGLPTINYTFSANPTSILTNENSTLTATVTGGTATGNIQFEFRCKSTDAYTNMGTASNTSYSFLCNSYTVAGTYYPQVRITRQGTVVESGATATPVVVTTAPPTPTPTPSPTPTPTPTTAPTPPPTAKKVNVLLLRYNTEMYTAADEVTFTNAYKKNEADLENASRFHGYKVPTALPTIDVVIKGQIKRTGGGPIAADTYEAFRAMMSTDVCNFIVTNKVDLVWLYFGDGSTGTYNQEYSWVNKYDSFVVCGGQRSFVSMTSNDGRGLYGENNVSLHIFGHFMESYLATLQTEELFQGRFSGMNDNNEFVNNNTLPINLLPPFYKMICGDVHYPPNSVDSGSDYDYHLPSTIANNSCEDWNPENTGAKKTIASTSWGCVANNDVDNHDGCPDNKYYWWWFNNMPSTGNNLTYQGKKIPPWFDFISDIDATIEYYGRHSNEYWMNTGVLNSWNPKLTLPYYMTDSTVENVGNFSELSGSFTSSIAQKIGAKSTNPFLVVAITYRTSNNQGSTPGTGSISSVKFGTVPMQLLERQAQHQYASELWYLPTASNPTAETSSKFSVSFSSPIDSMRLSGFSLTGVDQAAPLRTQSDQTTSIGKAIDPPSYGGSTSHSLAVTSQANDYVLTVHGGYSSLGGDASGSYEYSSTQAFGNIIQTMGLKIASGTSTNNTWSVDSEFPWNAIGISLKRIP